MSDHVNKCDAMAMGRSMRAMIAVVAAWAALAACAHGQPTFPKAGLYVPTADERQQVSERADELTAALAKLPSSAVADHVADVSIFLKSGTRALKYGEFYEKRDVAATVSMLEIGLKRARLLAEGKTPWAEARGAVGRGFVSSLDDSVQPYAVIVPEGLELSREKRARLDVVLHGRDGKISESRFLARHEGKPAGAADGGKITLHVFGRGNNAYRWAGESDVFEAISAVKRNYPIDDHRIVLRGFSMGGAGAWHLGLHHPSSWSSVEAGAGFTETKKYAKLKEVPPFIEKGLHIYDAVDYAMNAFDVPIAGYGGEIDPQLQGSTNIVEAIEGLGFPLKRDGLRTTADGMDFLRLVGAGMGHKVDPASAAVLKKFHDDRAVAGANLNPKRIRFVTYTTKYPQAAWLSVEQLEEHYRRAEIDAEVIGDKLVVHKAENVALLGVDRHVAESIVLDGRPLPLEPAVEGLLPKVYYRRLEGTWTTLDYKQSRAFELGREAVKRPGLQGPIDDAFTSRFLCVKGTGKGWNPAVDRWTTARLDAFLAEWAYWMRGEPRVKNDADVTPEDIEHSNLILFGDPSSNPLIAKMLKQLPRLSWTKGEVSLAGESYPAADHVPVLIGPNPLNPRRYAVINSGHTFGAADFAGTNALLYPRLGDFGVFRIAGKNATLRASGYFDEGWSLSPASDRGR